MLATVADDTRRPLPVQPARSRRRTRSPCRPPLRRTSPCGSPRRRARCHDSPRRARPWRPRRAHRASPVRSSRWSSLGRTPRSPPAPPGPSFDGTTRTSLSRPDLRPAVTQGSRWSCSGGRSRCAPESTRSPRGSPRPTVIDWPPSILRRAEALEEPSRLPSPDTMATSPVVERRGARGARPSSRRPRAASVWWCMFAISTPSTIRGPWPATARPGIVGVDVHLQRPSRRRRRAASLRSPTSVSSSASLHRGRPSTTNTVQ